MYVFLGAQLINPIMNTSLFDRYFSGNCTPDEHRQAGQWIEENLFTPEFDELSEDLLRRMPYSANGENRRSLAQVHRRINGADPSSFRAPRSRVWMAWAAASVALVLAVGIWFANGPGRQPRTLPVDLVEYYAACGKTRTVVLPDSTGVLLYADTRLLFDRNNFATTRQVWLYGDAYFDVVRNAGASFEVKGSHSSICVLGTRFSVMSHDVDDDFEVSLFEGRVRLASNFNNRRDTLTLTPGELVRIDKKLGTVSMQNIPGMDIDTTNIVYADTRLSDIAARLGRRYDKTIIIDDDAYARQDPRLYIMFEATDSLHNVLSAICHLSGLKTQTVGKGQILLTSK